MTNRAASPRVLVVDDETGILDSLRILLKNEGFTPVVAQGGQAGLEALVSSKPDILLSDIRMPARSRSSGDPDDGPGDAAVRDAGG